MKYGVFQYRESSNLGDEIQSIAAMQFLPAVDHFIDRDHLHEAADHGPMKVIFNGWFMARPRNWPPPKNIIPLFISFHINTLNDTHLHLLRPESLEYFRQHSPIGCRDHHTVRLLRQHGIDAYFSACLTLTLRNMHRQRNDKVYFIDVLYNLSERRRQKALKRIVPPDVLDQGVFLEQTNSNIMHDHDCKRKEARALLDILAQAKLVVTSRLHTALPCVAFGTPVLFMNYGLDSESDNVRFGGLMELFRSMNSDDMAAAGVGSFRENIGHLIRKGGIHRPAFDWKNPSPNPVDVAGIAQRLRDQCSAFVL